MTYHQALKHLIIVITAITQNKKLKIPVHYIVLTVLKQHF
jgi:hypothetical protein